MQDYQQQQLKQRRVLAAVILLVAVGGGVFLTSRYRPNLVNIDISDQSAADQVAVTTVTGPQFDVDEDLDADGLPDWQEILHGTDPRNPDTNGDGVGDLAEFQALIDSFDAVALEADQNTTPDGRLLLTNTDVVAQNMYAAAALLAQKEGGLTTAEQDAIADLTENEIIKSPEYDLSQIADFKFVPDSQAAYVQYVNDLISILDQLNIETFALPQVEQALTTNNQALLDDFSDIIENYDIVAAQLVALEAPQAFSQTHLAFTQAVEATATNLYGMQFVLNDPVLGLRHLVAYQKNFEYLIDLISVFYQQNFVPAYE